MLLKIKLYLSNIEMIDRILELRNKQKRVGFIQEIFPKNGVGAELGVFKGHLSPILLEITKPKILHLIDPWYFLSPRWVWARGNQSTVDALRRILKRLKKEIEQQQVVVHVEDDIKVLKSFPDNYFDWAYIDSSHAYEHTVHELEILKQKVKPEGVIAGDDWRPDKNHRHHGVFKAVHEFVDRENYSIIYADNDNLQWAIKKKESIL